MELFKGWDYAATTDRSMAIRFDAIDALEIISSLGEQGVPCRYDFDNGCIVMFKFGADWLYICDAEGCTYGR